MPLTHRPVEARDIPVICGFARSEAELFFLFPRACYPLTPEQLHKAIAQRSDATVIERDGEVLGFANFYRWETGGSCAIGNVVVAPEARGGGVGRYLIERMIEIAFTRHEAAEVTVSCFNENVAGLLFYPRLGFRPYAIEARQDWRGRPVALVHMRLARTPEAPAHGTGAGSAVYPPPQTHRKENTAMSLSEAMITCDNPQRLMNRLCRHWGHKFTVELSENDGFVDLPPGRCSFDCAPGVLRVRLDMADEELERMQGVVADHLQRMAGDTPLAIDWRPR